MRIVAGAWRGRVLAAPPGSATRPTSDRLRQALFDMIWHAPWGGRDALEGAAVLDAFAGTGALALEALSRGAARAVLFEREPAALTALRRNVAACGAEGRCRVIAADVLRAPRAAAGSACDVVFLDPPYGQDLIPTALAVLDAAGWIAPAALIVAETAREEALAVPATPLAERGYGAARVTVWRGAVAAAPPTP